MNVTAQAGAVRRTICGPMRNRPPANTLYGHIESIFSASHTVLVFWPGPPASH